MSGLHTRRVVLPAPHRFNPEPKTGLCADCPLLARHEVHSEAAIAAAERRRAGWVAEEARRVGERP